MTQRNKQIRTGRYERTMTLDLARLVDTETERMVPASLSSEQPVERWFGTEVLQHTPEAVDLGRAANGLPMLWVHDHRILIGKVRNLRLEDGRLEGYLHFSRNARATEIWQDVLDDFLDSISIGYSIRKWEEEANSDLIIVTRWAVNEASVVTVPADPTVGIGRYFHPDHEDTPMTDNRNGEPQPANGSGAGGTVVEFERARTVGQQEGRQAGITAERARIAEIEQIMQFRTNTPAGQALRLTAIEEGWNADQLRRHLLEQDAAAQAGPLADPSATDPERGIRHEGTPAIQPGRDALDGFRDGVAEAIAVRAQLETDPQAVQRAREGEYLSMSLADMAREYLRLQGLETRGLNRVQMVGEALTRAGSHTTSDFANVLADSARKALLLGWTEAPENWQLWARTGSLSDFKSNSRVGLSDFEDLDLVPEDGEYKAGTMSDLKETIQLATYGKLFRISRQAIINDDLAAFTTIPRKMGRAAGRKVGDLAYAVLTSNPTLNQDSTALFHANHSNLVASGSGAAPSVSTLDTAFTAMAKQTDPSGAATLNIRPAYIIVPAALEYTARVLVAAEVNPAEGSVTSFIEPNGFRGRLQVVSDARLDADSATAWYLAGNPGLYDTVEVAFLDGVTEPYLEQQEGWTTDGVEYKVRIDAAASALDYRALYKNAGA